MPLVGYVVHDNVRQHWWAARCDGPLVWAHDSTLPAPAPIKDYSELANALWNRGDTIFAIRQVGISRKQTPGPQLANQSYKSAPEFQSDRDQVVANMLFVKELQDSWKSDPPPFRGHSPQVTKSITSGESGVGCDCKCQRTACSLYNTRTPAAGDKDRCVSCGAIFTRDDATATQGARHTGTPKEDSPPHNPKDPKGTTNCVATIEPGAIRGQPGACRGSRPSGRRNSL